MTQSPPSTLQFDAEPDSLYSLSLASASCNKHTRQVLSLVSQFSVSLVVIQVHLTLEQHWYELGRSTY